MTRRYVSFLTPVLIGLVLVACPCAGRSQTTAAPYGATSRDWPMFRGGPKMTGVSPATLPEKLSVRWTLQCGESVTSSAAIVDGTVYVGSEDGLLVAVDLRTGKVRWKFKTEEAIRSSPTVYHGGVYFGDSKGVMYAVNAKTGKADWTFTTDAEIVSSVNPSGDRLVFGSYDGFIYCLSAKDGKLLWKAQTEGRVHGTPGIVDGRVIAAGCDEHLHVVKLSDGTALASVDMHSVTGVCAAIDGSMTYIGTYGSKVYGIDWQRARIVWSFADPDREFPYMSSAALAGGLVVLGGRDKYLHALDAKTGKSRWSLRTRGRIDSSPVIVGERVFVGSSDGSLYEVDLKSGHERWHYESGAPISASPAVADGALVVANEDGLLYCFAGNGK